MRSRARPAGTLVTRAIEGVSSKVIIASTIGLAHGRDPDGPRGCGAKDIAAVRIGTRARRRGTRPDRVLHSFAGAGYKTQAAGLHSAPFPAQRT